MNYHVDPHPAINATFSINTLDKSTRTADNAINWQLDIICISKHTFNPVINLKGGIAHRTQGLTRFRLYTLVQAEWTC
jgi:hypothetical protein